MGEHLINNIFVRMDNFEIEIFEKIEWSND